MKLMSVGPAIGVLLAIAASGIFFYNEGKQSVGPEDFRALTTFVKPRDGDTSGPEQYLSGPTIERAADAEGIAKKHSGWNGEGIVSVTVCPLKKTGDGYMAIAAKDSVTC
jgi:hypothetical protein